MMINAAQRALVPAAVLAAALLASVADGFAPPQSGIISRGRTASGIPHRYPSPRVGASYTMHPAPLGPKAPSKDQWFAPAPSAHCTRLSMSDSDDNQGPGLVAGLFISGVLLFFVLSAFAPLIDFMATSPSATDLSLGDSVVTRQDKDGKLKTYQSKFDALSPARVQEKLSNLPVFYVSIDKGSRMGENVYLSFNEAEVDAKSSGGVVKATTLDQVLFPLILKKEAGKVTANTPVEIKAARESATSSYSLVPSKAALNDAKDISLKEGDIPLFVVERLAFAGDDGRPQVPLFSERSDAITSYARLREGGGNKLPEQPTIRTTSLLDVLESMEKGTRPGVGQLQFYGNADDVIKADEMASR